MGRTDLSDQFRKIVIRYKRIGYYFNVMRQSACLHDFMLSICDTEINQSIKAINPITVDNFAALFNCTPMDRAIDCMMAPT